MWVAIKNRPVLFIFCACLSAFFHPTLGPEATLFFLLFTGVHTLLDFEQHSLIDTKLGSEKFLEIILFRTERTTVPTNFSPSFYYGAIGFLLVFAYSWILWYKQESTDKNMALSLLIIIVSILFFCFGGYLFIEIYPTRIWATARAF